MDIPDEVEATGTEVTGQLEHNVSFQVSAKSPFKDKDTRPRPFGGVNMCFLGDFWQLRPTGQIALMSNPCAAKVQENARAQAIMGMFWYSDLSFSLQRWDGDERLLHLNTNERSGADLWYSNVLDSCCTGSMTEDDYNLLHGSIIAIIIIIIVSSREV